MPLLNLSKAEHAALRHELTQGPVPPALESVRDKVKRLDREPVAIAGQMDVYDCIEESP